jgi:hypothetical protein
MRECGEFDTIDLQRRLSGRDPPFTLSSGAAAKVSNDFGVSPMTRFLRSDENPTGHRLEDILGILRADTLTRCSKIATDERPEALHVLNNNIKILQLLSDAIELARDSTRTLDRSFGPSKANDGGPPRIGGM